MPQQGRKEHYGQLNIWVLVSLLPSTCNGLKLVKTSERKRETKKFRASSVKRESYSKLSVDNLFRIRGLDIFFYKYGL